MKNLFMVAAIKQYRFSTPKGSMSVEQLFKISMKDLSDSIKALDASIKLVESTKSELDFLSDTIHVDSDDRNKFEIMKEIYLYRVEESKLKLEASDKKAKKEALMAELAKRESDTSRLTDEELRAKIEELSK
jgi:hypothetical protein